MTTAPTRAPTPALAPAPTPALRAVEIKAFVPARDFALSLRFYADLGFSVPWQDEDMAYLRVDESSFLLQRFHVPEHTANFMMHLLVPDVSSWWAHVTAQDLAGRYGVRVTPLDDRPWGMRDFTIDDPSGVLWRIGQNIPPAVPA